MAKRTPPTFRRLPTIREKAMVTEPIAPPDFITLVVTLPDGTSKEVNYINQGTLPPALRIQTAKAIVEKLITGKTVFDDAMGQALGKRLVEG